VPGVYKRGSRYVAVTQFRGKRIKSYHASKAEARRAKAQRAAGARPASREPFERYAERWLVEYRGRTSRGLSSSTRAAYALLFHTYVIPYFGGRRIGDIGRLDVKQFIDHLVALEPRHPQHGSKRLAGSTVRRIVAPLKAMFAEAYELEVLASDAAHVRVVVSDDRRTAKPKTLSAAQTTAVIARLSGRDQLLFVLLSRTGLRISEALGLQWGDIHETPAGPVLKVCRQCCDGQLCDRTKTPSSQRSVALVPALVRALENHRPAGAPPDAPIFASQRGTHQDAHNVRRRLRTAAAAAGVPWATPHVFRHSLATELLARGVDTLVIARILGHRDDTTTRRTYLHPPEAPRFDELDP
jgi:integrase